MALGSPSRSPDARSMSTTVFCAVNTVAPAIDAYASRPAPGSSPGGAPATTPPPRPAGAPGGPRRRRVRLTAGVGVQSGRRLGDDPAVAADDRPGRQVELAPPGH